MEKQYGGIVEESTHIRILRTGAQTKSVYDARKTKTVLDWGLSGASQVSNEEDLRMGILRPRANSTRSNTEFVLSPRSQNSSVAQQTLLIGII